MKTSSIFVAIVLCWPVHADDKKQVQGAQIFNATCSQCHGMKGEGNEQFRAPAIGGMAAWAVERQIDGFRKGHRGVDPKEPVALVMAATVKALPAEQIKNVAAAIEKLPIHSHKASTWQQSADLDYGKMLFEERCMECHRYNGTGEIVFGSPPLVGRQDWYLLAQLEKFVDGRRGALASDQFGQKMVNVTRIFESEKAMKDVVAYISTLRPPEVIAANPLPHSGANPFEEVTAKKP
ncbi:MAG: c-type cytochrome [Verrucomicrobiaceae bacterium]|nr:c-type cytochrome [Verrucomicrobiaceae bacterium]